ncbi:MAG: Phage integrase, site-specific serine recombinase, partial [uncultured Rubrobacteraceae bacterium]
ADRVREGFEAGPEAGPAARRAAGRRLREGLRGEGLQQGGRQKGAAGGVRLLQGRRRLGRGEARPAGEVFAGANRPGRRARGQGRGLPEPEGEPRHHDRRGEADIPRLRGVGGVREGDHPREDDGRTRVGEGEGPARRQAPGARREQGQAGPEAQGRGRALRGGDLLHARSGPLHALPVPERGRRRRRCARM